MRLIDADELYDMATKNIPDGGLLYRIPPSLVDKCPTIDAVEVVRCEDCRWIDIGENICERWVYCTLHRRDTGRKQYCSYGERKDG